MLEMPSGVSTRIGYTPTGISPFGSTRKDAYPPGAIVPFFSGASGVNEAGIVDQIFAPSPRFLPATVSVNGRPFWTPRGWRSVIRGSANSTVAPARNANSFNFIGRPRLRPPSARLEPARKPFAKRSRRRYKASPRRQIRPSPAFFHPEKTQPYKYPPNALCTRLREHPNRRHTDSLRAPRLRPRCGFHPATSRAQKSRPPAPRVAARASPLRQPSYFAGGPSNRRTECG